MPSFNYELTPPDKLRPYKAAAMTLGLGTARSHPNDLIMLDKSYAARLTYRRHLLRTHPETYAHQPHACWAAVSEFYSYVVAHHLPTRFPQHFSKSPSGTLVLNHTTTNTYPVVPQSAANALRALGENLDEDFVLLERGPAAAGQPSDVAWRVAAFVVCFPAGVRLAETLGRRLRDVPALQAQLGGPAVERCLDLLPPGVEHGVRRLAWTIARSGELFTPHGTHLGSDADADADAGADTDAIRPDQCCLRVERQTMWKLPGSGAAVVGIKTYTYPLAELKAEDAGAEGHRLAAAIEAMGDAMGRYRAGSVWGRQVLDYLRT